MKIMIKGILLESQMQNTRLLLAFSSLTWAFLLTFSGFDLFTNRQTYSIMEIICREEIWAALFAIHGVFALYSLKSEINCSLFVIMDGFLGCLLWTTSTTACFAAHWPHVGTFLQNIAAYNPPAAMSGELWVAIASWWHMIRQWVEKES
jgi:hypothetical protein